MIESIRFQGFKLLRDTELKLAPLTLIVGPNSSGKTTAIEGLNAVARRMRNEGSNIGPGAVSDSARRLQHVKIAVRWTLDGAGGTDELTWNREGQLVSESSSNSPIGKFLGRVSVFSGLDAGALRSPAALTPRATLGTRGEFLAVVLDRLRDDAPERFEALNESVRTWFGEYDQVLFDTPQQGLRSFGLRSSTTGTKVPATSLSEGTLFAVALLTLSLLPDPPSICCFEEPDRGIHPRLLRHVYEALVRLAEPRRFGDSREPVQVIATTHSPYFLDLFKERPESVVIAERLKDEAKFSRLIDIPHYAEIIESGALGHVWYTGVLGGVPLDA